MSDTLNCSKISLQRNQKNENVKKLQKALKTLKYYNTTVDSSFGPVTEQAVIAFQKAYSLKATGKVDEETCKKLTSVVAQKTTTSSTSTSTSTSTTNKNGKDDTTITIAVDKIDCTKVSLKNGSKGEQVTVLQQMLNKLGYYTKKIDGDFGYYTGLAVKAFQRKTGHTADGWFGTKTCPDLKKVFNEKYGSSTKTSTTSTTTTAKNANKILPEFYEQQVGYKLTVLPDVVVLPDTELNADGSKTVTNGAINAVTNFDCSKINLKKGSKGDNVKALQNVLKARGLYTREVDGDFGKYTEQAVKSLQSQLGGLKSDGWFGQETCKKLQGTNNVGGGDKNKKTNYVVTDFSQIPSVSDDVDGLSHEVTLQMVYSRERLKQLQRLQKTQFDMYLGDDIISSHEGYINEVKITPANHKFYIELTLVGYTVFLDKQLENYEKTAKRSELLKDIITQLGLKPDINTAGLTDDEYTIKITKASTSSSSEGGGGLTEVHGNDCTLTNPISARSFDIDTCYGNTKIGDSSANYAQDTRNMSAKEAILDLQRRFHYGPSLSSSAVYENNRFCPKKMWRSPSQGKFFGNCADAARLVKCVGEVHGLKVGIRHCPSHYYNLIEVNGKVYRFDLCFSSGYTGRNYGNELCNNLTKNGGPWKS